jgi:acetyl-CoA carboxylase biotin carboxyl carrier protein
MLAWILAMLMVLAVLTRVAASAPVEVTGQPVSDYILSPFSGTFIAGAHRGAEPYVSVGSKVETGTVVGNIEVWGKLHPVTSMVRGTVIEVLITDDANVETWQQLFKIQVEPEPTPA